MEIFLECLPCFLKQVIEASKMATNDINIQKKITKDTVELIGRYENYKYSPELGRDMHNIIKHHTGICDPYKRIKEKSIEIAESMYPNIKQFIYKKKDKRLYWALKAAATGNIIDYAINLNINIKECIINEIEREFGICDIERFMELMKSAKTILVIGDNAGETIFDRILIEELLQFKLIYAVRSNPIINDVTYEDACASGLEKCSKVLSSGCDAPGLILEKSSKEFMEVFESADIIISKGQANFETLSEVNREIFFLLKVKCPVVSKLLNVNINDFVFKCNKQGF